VGIQTTQSAGVTLLTCAGPLTVPDGKAAFVGAVDRQLRDGAARLVLDLREVPYMDSPTIGALMSSLKRALERGGGVKLVLGKNSKVLEILELTGLDKIVETFGDVDDAVTSFGAAGA
jgi:anti-sigma B factor antagonist